MNPRWLAYCAANGRSPDAQAAHDEEAWPGGRMTGYILWISAKWREWCDLVKLPRGHYMGPVEHKAFDVFLWGLS